MIPISYRSPKTEVRESTIHGRGLFAKAKINKGEIVRVKGGHFRAGKVKQPGWLKCAERSEPLFGRCRQNGPADQLDPTDRAGL